MSYTAYIKELERRALEKISPELGNYIQKTAGKGKVFRSGLAAFDRYAIIESNSPKPAVIDTSVILLGSKKLVPIGIAPTAFHQLFCTNGEQDTYGAAVEKSIVMGVSSFSTCSFAQINENMSHGWYQLLLYKNLDLMKQYAGLAHQSGCSAIIVTIDAVTGCSMCKASTESKQPTLRFPIHQLPLFPTLSELPYDTLDEYYANYMPTLVNWRDIADLIQSTPIPVVLKGVLDSSTVQKAIDVGAKGVIISNHGGRQNDNTISSLEALGKLDKKLFSQIDVYFDGGVRSGKDVFVALALGAKAVFLGRPVLYALAVGGRSELVRLLSSLEEELQDCIKLAGCKNISDICRDCLHSIV